MNAYNFLKETVLNNGATIGINGQTLSNGYLVSLAQFGEVIDIDNLDLRTIPKFVSNNENELNKDNRFLGSWINDDKLYLDVSVLITDKRIAIETAYKNNQTAIYDNVNDIVISLPTPQRSGTTTQQKAYLTQVIDNLCK